MSKYFLFLAFTFLYTSAWAQDLNQTIRGQIIDESSQEPLPFANIVILNTDPIIGTMTDQGGNFRIENVPVGRYDLKVSYIGYESVIKPEVVVTSTKEVILNISLIETTHNLDELVIKPRIIKDKSINAMSTVSSRMLSVEEANRYAGGFDDPARLASSFPGVASSVGNNGITIRGNSPKSLQWKIEGIEVPNPNHFADLGAFGGGGLTALSSNLLANSDFFTGAFPAEYNNALSGVFDIKMRSGNSSVYEHSFEVGAIGIDFASEGPLNKKGNGSYLLNYRYSTLGLVSSLLPEDADGTNYQDLSFKIKMPSKNSGLFSLWGIGLLDNSGTTPDPDVSNHNYFQDIEKSTVKQYMGALGLNHRIVLKSSSYINSTLAFSTNGLDLKTDRLNSQSELNPEHVRNNTYYNITFKSFINKKFSARHSNRTGITLRGLGYNLTLQESDHSNPGLSTLVSEDGFSTLISGYSNSSFSLKDVKINIGLNTQLFTLNKNYTIEPRIGLSYRVSTSNQLSLGYGLHSRLEPLNIYFVNTENTSNPQANKNLDFMKAHHLVLAWDLNITDKLHLKIEPYYQLLFNVPIVPGSNSSLINLQNDPFINDTYINSGKGKNYGIDVVLEQYMNNGFYYLLSGSVFNSQYKPDSDEWYNTRYNKNYLFNALVGKEYIVGKNNQNTIGINLKLNIQGGDRFSIIDDEASVFQQDVVYDETTPFTEQAETALLFHFTVSYAWNKKNTSHKLSLKMINTTNYQEFQGHRFNIKTNEVEELRESLIIPNLSYKISF